MPEPSLKTGIWVSAQIRLCDITNMPALVRHKGDPDAGSVILKLDRLDGTSMLLSQSRDGEGRRAWLAPLGRAAAGNDKIEEYIGRRLAQDPDIWVLEIEDRHAAYIPDAPVLD
ncbi:MAG: DUF1491 family protein [Proteobacteria bacterium]|nr:DUF1491 family protein [Pseudomonadota bacterium]